MIYAFYFYVFVVDPPRLCRHCASARFCDVTEDVFIVPSSEVVRRARAATRLPCNCCSGSGPS